jgi:hypothetical protein
MTSSISYSGSGVIPHVSDVYAGGGAAAGMLPHLAFSSARLMSAALSLEEVWRRLLLPLLLLEGLLARSSDWLSPAMLGVASTTTCMYCGGPAA